MPIAEFEPVVPGTGEPQERYYEASKLPPIGAVRRFGGIAYRRKIPTLGGVNGAKDETFASWQPTLTDPTVKHRDHLGRAIFRTKAEAREWAKKSETEHGGYAYDV